MSLPSLAASSPQRPTSAVVYPSDPIPATASLPSAPGASSIGSSNPPVEAPKSESKPVLTKEKRGCCRAIADFLVMLWQKIILCFRSKDEKAAIKTFRQALAKALVNEEEEYQRDLREHRIVASILQDLSEEALTQENFLKRVEGSEQLSAITKRRIHDMIKKDADFAVSMEKIKESVVGGPPSWDAYKPEPSEIFLRCCVKESWKPKMRNAVYQQLEGPEKRRLEASFTRLRPAQRVEFGVFVKTASPADFTASLHADFQVTC